MSFATAVLAQTETTNELFMPPWGFGLTAIIIFAVLGFVIWTYRDVANRHSHRTGPHAAEHATAPGATHHGTGHPTESGH